MKALSKFAAIAAIATFVATQTHAALLTSDTFSYPDGSLTNNSGGVWTWLGSGAGSPDIQVVSGQAQFNTLNGPDDRIQLGSSNTVGALYASFTLDMTSLPTGNGNYFATFCDAGTQNFKGRVFVTTAG